MAKKLSPPPPPPPPSAAPQSWTPPPVADLSRPTIEAVVGLAYDAFDLGELGRRVRSAWPDLPEVERLALIRAAMSKINETWASSPARKARERLARGASQTRPSELVGEDDAS
jgi:hypothetical protein